MRALFLLLAAALPIHAQDAPSDQCKEFATVPLPSEAAVAKPSEYPACESYKSYAGIGHPIDYAGARACAWQERAAQLADLQPRNGIAAVFGGSAMLTVLYANGEGVQQNFPLALRMACEAGGAPAEIKIRLDDLQKRQDHPDPKAAKFDFCNDITSGFMMGFCTARSEEIDGQMRSSKFAQLSRSWSQPQQAAFEHMLSLEAEYAEAHARGEIDLSGTARAMFQIDAESSLKDDILAAIQSFEAGKPPHATAITAAQADAELNRAYRKMLQEAEGHKDEYGAIQPEGIRAAERAWLRYRDAWLGFAELRYPAVPREVWLDLLTKDRTLILLGKSCGALEECDGEEQWSPRPLP